NVRILAPDAGSVGAGTFGTPARDIARQCNMRHMRRLSALGALAVSAGLAVFIAQPYVHGLAFVVRAADLHGPLRRVADFDRVADREREIAIPTSRGPIRARVCEPAGSPKRATLLTSGLHPSGIDEPRLVRLARNLAAQRVLVVTPDIPELSQFEI